MVLIDRSTLSTWVTKFMCYLCASNRNPLFVSAIWTEHPGFIKNQRIKGLLTLQRIWALVESAVRCLNICIDCDWFDGHRALWRNAQSTSSTEVQNIRIWFCERVWCAPHKEFTLSRSLCRIFPILNLVTSNALIFIYASQTQPQFARRRIENGKWRSGEKMEHSSKCTHACTRLTLQITKGKQFSTSQRSNISTRRFGWWFDVGNPLNAIANARAMPLIISIFTHTFSLGFFSNLFVGLFFLSLSLGVCVRRWQRRRLRAEINAFNE